jgi:cobalt-zinc-cadmium efflux system outer membrane protein
VLPAAQAHLEEMQLHYNAMLEDVYELIEAAETNVEAGKEYVESLAEFWIARAELADLVGGRLRTRPPRRRRGRARDH